jgi:uncharacterized iron-regulated membrane protein
MKKLAGVLHLWLGLASGIIVLIVSLTGCIFVFEEEIFNLTHRKLIYVNSYRETVKPLSALMATAQEVLGEKKKISSAEVRNDRNRSYIFTASKADKKAKHVWTYFQQVKYYEEVYINPYTGAVLGKVDRKYEFFNVVRRIHQNLLLPYETGSLIVGSSCLMFLVLLITGFVLWIPKSKSGWKQRFSIKWNAKWRRVNYDTHNVGGFYVMPFAMIIVMTGLVWSFDWWEDGIYRMLGSKQRPKFIIEQPVLATKATPSENLTDKVFQAALNKKISFSILNLAVPQKKNIPYQVSLEVNKGTGWRESNYYFYQNTTGEQYGQILQEDKSLGMKWRNSNYNIHTGGIFGIPTKILAFLVSLFCATLPVTGFYIWWGKRNKTKKSAVKTISKKTTGEFSGKLPPTKRKMIQNS